MIDLHTHSIYSDGTDSVEKLVQLFNDKNLKVCSIADHNKVDAYNLENQKHLKNIKGKIIKGVELTTTYKKIPIEILVYNFDIDIIKEFTDKHYPSFVDDKIRRANLCIDVLEAKGVNLDRKKILDKAKHHSVSACILENLKEYKSNLKFIGYNTKMTKKYFSRVVLGDTNSPLFVDYSPLYPSIEQVLDISSKANGLCFLAHPFEYGKSARAILIDIYKKYAFDGIECFYPKFSKEQVLFLLDFAKKNKLLVSGGSDYHGKNREVEIAANMCFGKAAVERHIKKWLKF